MLRRSSFAGQMYDPSRRVLAEDFVNQQHAQGLLDGEKIVVGLLVDGEERGLSEYMPRVFNQVSPIYHDSSAGAAILLSTACFVLGAAARQIYGRSFRIMHSGGFEATSLLGGYYCEIDGVNLSESDNFGSLVALAREFMEEGRGLSVESYVMEDVEARLERQQDKLSLRKVKNVKSDSHQCYHMEGYTSLYVQPYTPDTSLCGLWESVEFDSNVESNPGLIVRMNYMPKFQIYVPLFAAYKRGLSWGFLSNRDSVGAVNELILAGKGQEFMDLEEERFNNEIMKCALTIRATRPNVKAILIAGPSASGKTTFAAKLSVALSALGFQPQPLSTDDYYRDSRDPDYPRSPDGKLNFETVEALRLKFFFEQIEHLFAGEPVETPVFDMVLSRPKEKGRMITLPKSGVLVVEGIFSLDRKITEGFDADKIFKIFIVPLPYCCISEHHYLSNQTIRTLRRISRDKLHRGRSASVSIARLHGVLAGEEQNIFPNMKNADFFFNSFMAHELPVLRMYCEPLLKSVPPSDPTYKTARSLMALLNEFYPCPYQLSESSLIREFVGGSIFEIEEVPLKKYEKKARDGSCGGFFDLKALREEKAKKGDTTPLLVSQLVNADSDKVTRQNSLSGIAAGGTAQKDDMSKNIAAIVNGELRAIHGKVDPGQNTAYVTIVQTRSTLGMQVYRATLCFLVHVATKSLFPDRTASIPHGFGLEGGKLSKAYYVRFLSSSSGSMNYETDSVLIKARMLEYVKQGLQIKLEVVRTEEAIEHFRKNGQEYSAKLLETRNPPTIQLCRCDVLNEQGEEISVKCIRFQPLAPDASYVPHFDLQAWGDRGLALCFPSQEELSLGEALGDSPIRMPKDNQGVIAQLNEFRVERKTAQALRCLGDLNERIHSGKGRQVVRVADALDLVLFDRIRENIVEKNISVLMIAGGFSSGKSVLCSKLRTHFQAHGTQAVTLSIEKYRRPLNDPSFPLLPDSSQPDLESADSILFDEISADMEKLLSGASVKIPDCFKLNSDTKTIERCDSTKTVTPSEQMLIIVDGEFALHPLLAPNVPREKKFFIMSTPLPILNIDELHFTSNHVLRVIRRIIRDYSVAGITAEETLANWGYCGEVTEKNIMPYLRNVDLVLNTSAIYELNAVRSHVSSLLRHITMKNPVEYCQAQQLLQMLKWFHDMPEADIPGTAAIQEFLGGSPFD